MLSDDPVVNSSGYISNLISMGIYNFAKSEDELNYLYDNPNSYKDVAHLQEIDIAETVSHISLDKVDSGVRIIAFKNFTSHAGATSLIYMLKRQLSKDYFVVALEVNKSDFLFYNDRDMISCKALELQSYLIKYSNANIILVDLNDFDISMAHHLCGDVIFLMESSTLMINKSVMLDQRCFEKLVGEKVVLNRSLLNSKDIKQLQFEANINFFAVLPPLNDRVDNADVLFSFLEKLGLYRRVGD